MGGGDDVKVVPPLTVQFVLMVEIKKFRTLAGWD